MQIREVPKPAPADDEVLIKALATTVNSGDARVRALRVPRGLRLAMRLRLGLTKPKQPILGFDDGRAGRGGRDRGHPLPAGRQGGGLTRSRLRLPRRVRHRGRAGAIATIPEHLSYQDAVALCFGGVTALHFFRLGNVAAGENVLINGASGAVGTMAVQLAKHLGAEVTAVCSGANAELVRGLGADHVIDYTAEDFTRNGQRYDVIMDNHGNAPTRGSRARWHRAAAS